ncbi:MAG: long-chain-fatty-acyl-CoA reductase [Oscillospiraceae bacterium]|nr:long-chain-fatty-acyl-CoA reductase [Oscillospiraceae bacterium]
MPISSDKVQVLCGCNDLDAMTAQCALPPFSKVVCEFFSALSAEIMKHPEAKQYPDVVTFGFFCRRGNIQRLKDEYSDKISNRLGRGVSFHIAPSNVPINFAYSLAAALLAGNSCIVRASSKGFRQIGLVCECIQNTISLVEFREIASRISVICYERSREINDRLSALADVRIIWGGDATVTELRSSPLSPRAVDIAFADRYSLAVMDARAVIDTADLKRLAQDFYNDTYLYDQNACSSPRLVYWLGDNEDTASAAELFWEAVHKEAAARYHIEPVVAVDKYTEACRMAIEHNADIRSGKDNLISRIVVDSLSADLPDHRCAGGSFIEYHSSSLDALKTIVTKKYQTLSYFGVDRQTLMQFVVGNGLSGIDRIVPIGKTADFSLVWDGYDLIMQMSRVIGF